jgi:RNA polymerase sigma factor (sigma-70 family)
VTEPAEIAARATALLLDVAAGVPGAAQDYDTLLYPIVLAMVKRRGRLLGVEAAQLTGTEGVSVPFVPHSDLAWVANDVAVHALERARTSAHRFNPDRGDGATWALRAAVFSYVDVVRTTYGARRGLVVVPTDDDELAEEIGRHQVGVDPAVVVEQRAALDAALAALSAHERFVVLATMHHGLSYAETAELLFGDPAQVRRVDRLRQSARRVLANAERAWRFSGQTGADGSR